MIGEHFGIVESPARFQCFEPVTALALCRAFGRYLLGSGYGDVLVTGHVRLRFEYALGFGVHLFSRGRRRIDIVGILARARAGEFHHLLRGKVHEQGRKAARRQVGRVADIGHSRRGKGPPVRAFGRVEKRGGRLGMRVAPEDEPQAAAGREEHREQPPHGDVHGGNDGFRAVGGHHALVPLHGYFEALAFAKGLKRLEEGRAVLGYPRLHRAMAASLVAEAGFLKADLRAFGQGHRAGEHDAARPAPPHVPFDAVHVGLEEHAGAGLVGDAVVVRLAGSVVGREAEPAGDFVVHVRPDYLRLHGLAVRLDAHHFHGRFLHEGGTAGIGAVEEVERAFELRAEALQVLHHGHFAAGQDFHIDEAGRGLRGG